MADPAPAPDAEDTGDETGTTTGDGDCTVIGPEDVATDLTLPAGCYLVEQPLNVDGVTVSVEPDVDITFAAQTGLSITGSGVLSAIGTADAPIVLHGETEERGSWAGLSFSNAPSSSNALEGVIVTHATGIQVSDGSRLRVAASEILNSASFGIDAAEGSEVTVATSRFESNAAPLSLGLSTVEGVAADNIFADNDDMFALVTSQTLADTATWHAIGIPFRMEGRFFLEAALTLEPGVTIQVPQDLEIFVEPAGQLNAVGTAESPITFTGVQAEVGFWRGIRFASTSSNNVLDHCLVEFAGSDDWFGGGDASASIYVPEAGKLILRNSRISGSGWYGLLATRGSDIAGFEGNTFADNERTLFVVGDEGGHVAADTVFENNAEMVVRIGMGNNDGIETAQTWAALQIPWRLTDRLFVYADLTVAAGAVIEVAQETAIYVEPEGSLHAAGDPNNPVVFTGADSVRGYWVGIAFESTASANHLENTVIEYACSDAWHGGADAEAAVYLPEDGLAQLTDTTIRECAGHGALLNGGTLNCAGVTFEALNGDPVSGTGSSNCS